MKMDLRYFITDTQNPILGIVVIVFTQLVIVVIERVSGRFADAINIIVR